MAVVFWSKTNAGGDGWPLSTQFNQSYDLNDSGSPVPNDTASSCTIVDASAGTTIYVYDSPDASTSDDWAEIQVVSNVSAPVVVSTFENSTSYGGGSVKVTYYKKNGLNGKVSNIKITT
ncbi:MAG: hypothetical protein HC897_12620 [Thermoanaerobaculia bacterium]|nr:hypothetical protein [Thermoanaerobaculia bacterium]